MGEAARSETKVQNPEPVYMTQTALESLREYSCSMPTGVFIGKQWRSNTNAFINDEEPNWWLAEYVEVSDSKKAGVKWNPIIVVDEDSLTRELEALREQVLAYEPGRVHDPHGAKWDELRIAIDLRIRELARMVKGLSFVPNHDGRRD